MTDRTPTRYLSLSQSMAIGLTGSLAVCLSHVRCSHMLLPLSCLLMPLFVSLVLARTLLFSPNATSLNAYATSLNAYSHTLAPISHPTPPQSRAKGKATISRGVEPADHKVSRRRVADCTGAREYLVEGTGGAQAAMSNPIYSQ